MTKYLFIGGRSDGEWHVMHDEVYSHRIAYGLGTDAPNTLYQAMELSGEDGGPVRVFVPEGTTGFDVLQLLVKSYKGQTNSPFKKRGIMEPDPTQAIFGLPVVITDAVPRGTVMIGSYPKPERDNMTLEEYAQQCAKRFAVLRIEDQKK